MILRRLQQSLQRSTIQRCPECDTVIEFDSINMSEGVAACNQCRKLFRLSELNWNHRSREEVLQKKPSGCSLTPWGQSLVVIASTRSIPGFIGLLFFTLFWNGITSVFVAVAMAGLWVNFVGPLPDWFPAPGVKNGQPLVNNAPMGVGETLFLCLFLLPFVAIGTGMAIASLMALFGRVKVVIDELDSYVSTGIGFLSWKKHFDANSVETVRFTRPDWGESGNKSQSAIELLADTPIQFGSILPNDRRQWLGAVLQKIFSDNTHDHSRPAPDDATIPIPHWLHSDR